MLLSSLSWPLLLDNAKKVRFDKQILVSFAVAWGNIWIPSFVFSPTGISTKLMLLNEGLNGVMALTAIG